MTLEGRLVGPWVPELEKIWNDSLRKSATEPIQVDLSGVTFVDSEGKKLLGRIFRQGAKLCASNIMSKFVLEESCSESDVS
jgi:hypothetical protein